MENILKDEWLKGNIVPRDFEFIFKNKHLVTYNFNHDKYDDEKIIHELCLNLVDNLIEKEMITFFDDIPDMVVIVPIQDIGISDGEYDVLYIETFHYTIENGEYETLHDLGYDTPMELSNFFGIENKIYCTKTLYSFN
jgi:hypothetical protein